MMKYTIHMFFVLGFWGFSTPAEACRCVDKTQQQYFAQATDVFLARATGINTKTYLVDQLDVVITLKGNPVKPFPIPNKEPCARRFYPNEISIVFFHNNEINICSGNETLPNQLNGLIDLLKAAKATEVPPITVAKSALQQVLLPYLHDRKELFVSYGQASKESVVFSKTAVNFVDAIDGLPSDGVVELEGLQYDNFHVVSGSFAAEGIQFVVAFIEEEGKLLFVGKKIVETK